MLNLGQQSPIAFAVYRREVGFDQQLNSDFAYGNTINRLSANWSWLNVQIHFAKSKALESILPKDFTPAQTAELIFTEWLGRICRKFIESESNSLVILNSSLYLSDGFEKLVLRLVEDFQEEWGVISLFPVSPISKNQFDGSKELFVSTEISRLGFLLSRDSCTKLISILNNDPLVGFNESIDKLNVTHLTISDSAPERPYLWLNIVASEDLMATTTTQRSNQPQDFTGGVKLDGKAPKVHAFISHWFSTWENVGEVERACLNAGYKTSVINTTDESKAGWLNEVPISFFRQFEVACNNFDQNSDYMLFITADVISQEWEEFFECASQVLALQSVGTLSPTLTYDHYNIGRFKPIYFDPGLPIAIIQCNDLLVTYINQSTIKEMIKFFHFFNRAADNFDPVVGFGLEELISFISSALGFINLRDRSFSLVHPEGSSYNRGVALIERESIMKIAERFLFCAENLRTKEECLGEFSFESIAMIPHIRNFR
jgi:hypothetical protein